MIDFRINNESSWIIELIEFQYINISTYRPLSKCFNIDLPVELKSQKKRTNKDQKQRSKMFFMVSC